MIEMVVGLVALLAIFAGLIQISRLARARTEAMNEARKKAGEYAVSAVRQSESPDPLFIYENDAGDDGRNFSADDESRPIASALAMNQLMGPLRPDALGARAPNNEITDLYHDSAPVLAFDLVHAREKSETIPLMPVVRHLLYDRENIQVTADAWMTWTRGLDP